MSYRDLFIFSLGEDARRFSVEAPGDRYVATTPAGLLERVRGLELRDVVVDPSVRLSDHARQELRARQRAPSAYIVENITHNEFAELVQGAVRP